ncbi:MAG: hypothetical protein N2385_14675, partial [Chloroflexus sp.]|nr:hypothetical protein [Chloroflexus sp.]
MEAQETGRGGHQVAKADGVTDRDGLPFERGVHLKVLPGERRDLPAQGGAAGRFDRVAGRQDVTRRFGMGFVPGAAGGLDQAPAAFDAGVLAQEVEGEAQTGAAPAPFEQRGGQVAVWGVTGRLVQA